MNPVTSWSAEANAELEVLKKQTRALTAQAVKEGLLYKPPECTRCGSTVKIEAHHPEYLDPYSVEWLCQKCHRSLHARLNKAATHRLGVPASYLERKTTRKVPKNEQEGMSKGGGQ